MIWSPARLPFIAEVPPAVAVGDVHAGQERAVDVVGDLNPGADGERLIGFDVAERAQIGGDARRQAERRTER